MVDVTDITDGSPEGSGYFDKFMDAINAQLHTQYSQGRIQGSDYANVYLGALQTALAQAVAYVGVVEQVSASQGRTAAEIALLEQKKLTEEAQTKPVLSDSTVVFDTATKTGYGAVGKQQQVQQAQSDGFLRDAEQKALKILMDSWNISRSTDSGTIPPAGATNDDISDLIIKLREGISVTSSIFTNVADAGNDKDIVSLEKSVILDGTGSTLPVDATSATYLWTQIGGTTVTNLIDNSKKIAYFDAPAIDTVSTQNNIIKFRLDVTPNTYTTPESAFVTYTIV